MDYHRRPLTRAEFDERCARLEELHPELSQTSGKRSAERNAQVGGNPQSDHLEGFAKDYVDTGMPYTVMPCPRAAELVHSAKVLGLWGLVHGDGSRQHLHVQATPPGAE